MPLLNLLQLFQTDDQATIIDKINYNLDQILSIGGGPPGATGIQGIQGIPGQQGIQGFVGDSGADGSYWFVQPSTVAPSIPTPKEDDLWLQTDNNNILRYQGSPLTWTVIGNLSAPNQTGVIRSNGNIYVAGDEDGLAPGIDGDTVLGYDPLNNEERGNVVIHGDLITGLTSPAGWIQHGLDDSDVVTLESGTYETSQNVAQDECFITYKIIGKTVFLNFQINNIGTSTNDSDAMAILLPTALQDVKIRYEDTVFWQTAPGSGMGAPVYLGNGQSMGYYFDKGRSIFFPVYITVGKSGDLDPAFGAGQWALIVKPLDVMIDNTHVYKNTGGTESIQGSLTFEIN